MSIHHIAATLAILGTGAALSSGCARKADVTAVPTSTGGAKAEGSCGGAKAEGSCGGAKAEGSCGGAKAEGSCGASKPK